MTEVRVRKGRYLCRLRAVGHATGSPEVCAAISAVVYTLAGWVENAGATRRLLLKPGDTAIDAAGGPKVQAAYEMAEIGLRQLAKAYPECIRVID